ncbi:MAG: flagellar biosynthetic protein FliR [Alphaproteobacteria bacterium]|nr:flagellar biosynthetic protein FliR [Alphaproteobacteria bacterium]MBV9695156.1 flagellar biosynthetic protein FliR [Alphaproteobacteria bacterium]
MAGLVLADWAASALVLGLRLAPVFAFAPPFTLVPMPVFFRVLFALGLSIVLIGGHRDLALLSAENLPQLAEAAVHELALGLLIVLAFQVGFGALYIAGRTIDIQAGFGLAGLVDPATRSQVPLIGTLFAYAAAAVFFGFDGHVALLRFLSASLDAIPLGTWVLPHSIARISAFMALMSLSAFGVAGATILALFLSDVSIALLSRTVPQMNVLVLGFQVKTILLLLVLPLSFGAAGALIVRFAAVLLEALPRLI